MKILTMSSLYSEKLFSTFGHGCQMLNQSKSIGSSIKKRFIKFSGQETRNYFSAKTPLILFNYSSVFKCPHSNNLSAYFKSQCKIQLARNYCSALFITNDKLSKLCSLVSPALDITHVLNSKENILNNLYRRKLDSSEYDFSLIQEYYEKYVLIEKTITQLEYKIIEIEDFLLHNKANLDPHHVEVKNQERRELRGEIKKFDDFILDFQKKVIIKVLKLPNELGPNTPDVLETIDLFDPQPSLKKKKTIDTDVLKKHVRFANKLDVNFLGCAAKFKYLFPIILKNYFTTEHNYIPFTNTDLCKGIIIEGCGTPYMCPWENIVLVNNENDPGEIGHDEHRYHLVGSSHMSMFCAYHTNHSVNYKDLPIKYVASGNQYGFQSLIQEHNFLKNNRQPSIEHLYNSVHKESVSLFVGTDSHDNLVKELENLKNIFKSFLVNLKTKHRICRVPASSLHSSESERIAYQVFSDSMQTWVTWADISVSGDYVSKRLNMCYHKSVTTYERQYCHTLNASVYVNVLLVNLIENGESLDVDHFKKGLN